jgi:mono/diheme cytochrome c family protein
MKPSRGYRTGLRLVAVACLAAWWVLDGGAPRVVGGASGEAASIVAMRLLKAECFSCHNQEKKKGGLVLTSRERLLEGGDNGAVALPGQPEASPLLKALSKDADPHMPPKKQLTDAQINILREWIQSGLVWNQATLDEDEAIIPVGLAPLPASYQPVLTLALSADGGKLAVGRGGAVFIHAASQTNLPGIAQIQAHQDAVQSLAWSRDGRWLASGGFQRLVLWNGESFQPERQWTNGLAGRLTAIRFLPDVGQLLIADSVGGQGGYLRLLNLKDGTLAASWRAHEDTIFDMDLSDDGKQLVTGGGDKLVKVWDLVARKETARLEGHTAQVLAVVFNTNATQAVSGGADKQLKVWDVETRHATSSLGRHSSALTAVAWPADGRMIVAGTDGGALFTYRNVKAHSGRESSESGEERNVGEAGGTMHCLAVSPDAKTIFAGTHDGVVQAWSSEGKLLAKLAPPTHAMLQAVAPPQGDRSSREEETLFKRGPRNVERGIEIRASLRRLLQNGNLVALSVEPKEMLLSPGAPRHGLLVTAHTAEGFALDVTAETRLAVSRSAPFEVTPSGEILARRPGEGAVIAHFSGRQVGIPVTVGGGLQPERPAPARRESSVAQRAEPEPGAPDQRNGVSDSAAAFAPPPVSFVRDVLPALSKAGCNAGPCHAKPDGQNGFRLSVFSHDTKSDYHEIVRENRGRRVFPAAPDESLLLRKPMGLMPHEGGLRFEPGSDTHRLLVRWMREGMAYALTNEPALERIVAFPKEGRYRKGARQRLLVQARYADGSIRDVTRLAAFDSNDKEIATVDERGQITIGTLTGQSVVVARYMGLVAGSQILVPADRLLPEHEYTALPKHNFIDELADAHFQRLGLRPSGLCTDAEFLRRASLDAIGVLPTPEEVREFLGACKAGAEEKRGKGEKETAGNSPPPLFSSAPFPAPARRALIDRLLARPEYADYWANKWADLLRPNPDRVGVKSVFVFDQWLRERFRQNQPYDQFVRDLLLAEGTNHRDGPAVVYRDRREPADLTTMFSQLFLGTRLECAKCHHHPNEKWSQDDFYQFAAFFGSVKQKGAGLSPPISGGTETFFFAPAGRSVKHPVTGEAMSPRALDGPLQEVPADTDPRRELVRWLTAPDNPFFARAAVNRVWAEFFGRGLVEPVDDFRISNPCVNPPLLEALAADFARHGYDLKHLMRTIMESRLYQLSTTPNETNLADTRNFSRAYRRRLSAEVLLDAINDVTGVPDPFAAMPAGSRATQTWSYKIESPLMDAFNRPNPSSDPPCERDRRLSVVQSLHLMNSKALQAKLGSKTGRARQLAESTMPPGEIVTELYLLTFSRPPSAEELKLATATFSASTATRQTATEDVLWSLLNSAEFVFNH